MLLEKQREDIVQYGKRMQSERLTAGTSGNISILDPETGYMAISPSGIPYDKTRPEDIVIMDIAGHIIEGTRKPSSEQGLHRMIYERRPDAGAIVHAHSMYCTTLACLGIPLKSVHYAIAEAGTDTIPIAPYRTFGTMELAQAAADAIGPVSRGLLLKNHGMLALGLSIEKAFSLACTMEWCAQIQYRCMTAGTPHILTHEQMDAAIERYRGYGQGSDEKTSGESPCAISKK